MDKIKTVFGILGDVLCWLAAVICLLMAFTSLGSPAPYVLFPAAVLFLPLRPLKNFWKAAHFKRGAVVAVAVVLLISGLMNHPMAQPDEPEPSRSVTLAALPTETPAPTPSPTPTPTPSPTPRPSPTPAIREYVLNTKTQKFHYPSCNSVKDIAPGNRQDYKGTRDSVIAMGYNSCARCNP